MLLCNSLLTPLELQARRMRRWRAAFMAERSAVEELSGSARH